MLKLIVVKCNGNNISQFELRYNQTIKSPQVRLIDDKSNMLGIMPTAKALELARQRGKDLVEVSPNANPPVCKLLDYGKYKFEMQKKHAESKKKQKIQQLKEVQLRPNIGKGDFEVKKNRIIGFLKDNAKIRLVMKFRGREIQYINKGYEIIENLAKELEDIATFEINKKPEVKQILAMIRSKV